MRRAGVVEGDRGHAGAHDIEAVQRRLGGDRLGLAGDGEAVARSKCSAILCLFRTAPTFSAMLVALCSGRCRRSPAGSRRAPSRSPPAVPRACGRVRGRGPDWQAPGQVRSRPGMVEWVDGGPGCCSRWPNGLPRTQARRCEPATPRCRCSIPAER
jgi:hypothetical protein